MTPEAKLIRDLKKLLRKYRDQRAEIKSGVYYHGSEVVSMHITDIELILNNYKEGKRK